MKNNNPFLLRTTAHFLPGLLLAVTAGLSFSTAGAGPSMSAAEAAGIASSGKASNLGEMGVQALRIKGKLNLKSSSVIVMDEANAAILYSKRADVPMPVASITKLLTALVVLEGEQGLDEQITITEEDRDTEKGSSSRLPFGTELTRDELLHLALMASENRAAHAMARSYPGGLTAFVHAMNVKAKALGMSSAFFADPTGLSSLNVSSAADLIKLVSAASFNPVIREYSTYQSYAVMIGRRLVEFHSTNSLVALPDWEIAVQKTGYTVDAGRCLVMKALIQDRPVLMVLLHSSGTKTRIADARRVKKWVESATVPLTAATLSSRNL
jgi:D-alanyl-D-alanine endopeptidase (penicillin-binding protein 7)